MSYEGAKLFIKGLKEHVTQQQIEDELQRFGRITHIWVARSPPGFCFVTFNDSKSVDDAVKSLNGQVMWSCELRVERARTGSHNSSSRSRHYEEDEVKCFNCNNFGHKATACQEPINKGECYTCNKPGHKQRDCPKRDRYSRHSRSRSPRRYGPRGRSPRRYRSRSPRRYSPRGRSPRRYSRSRSPRRYSPRRYSPRGRSPRRHSRSRSPRRYSPRDYSPRKSPKHYDSEFYRPERLPGDVPIRQTPLSPVRRSRSPVRRSRSPILHSASPSYTQGVEN